MNKEVCICNDPVHGWHGLELNGSPCCFRGFVIIDNVISEGEDAAIAVVKLLGGETRRERITSLLQSLKGDFAFFVERSDAIIAVVDKIRSFPIFFSHEGKRLLLGNSARLLREKLPQAAFDQNGLLEFQMTGFVTEQNTLRQGVKQLRPGECLYFDKASVENVETWRYRSFYTPEKEEKSEDEWLAEFDAVNEETFQDVIRSLKGRPVWVPLSGGLDSRLVVAMLKHQGYDRVTAFSYGLPGNYQAEVARRVAGKLGVKWLFIPYTHQVTRKRFREEKRKEYFAYADGLCSVPFLSDYYALAHLREKKIIDPDAVIINGQSGDFITGGHIPEFRGQGEVNWRNFLVESIINKHFSLWSDLKSKENIGWAERRLADHFGAFPEPKGPQDVADLFEHWEWQERQSKYVVNGQRAFEFFGYDWRLPLWSDQYFDFWQKVPWQHKMNQSLYKKYLRKKDPMGVFSMELPAYYVSPRYLLLFSLLVSIAARFNRQSKLVLENRFLKYFMYYGPFYSYLTYRQYLNHSDYHRNVVSFLVYEVLKNAGDECLSLVAPQRRSLMS
ncbi:MAG: hypothetical protein HY885_10435 [Deltaproteobacteria bacterium]|nr:hypothetical protein [Deltaproteobacteria bacterium]